jgi:predicted  nucleic acid-binding Zn-ribbon protein
MKRGSIVNKHCLLAILAITFALPATTAFAQSNSTLDSDIAVLRSDVRAQRTQIVSDQLQLNDAEGKTFWPIYRDYEAEMSKLNDEKVAIIKDYATSYDTMTDTQIQSLADRTFKLENKRTDLKQKYFKKISKAVSPKTAARFIQVDNRLDLLVNLQIADSVPMLAK